MNNWQEYVGQQIVPQDEKLGECWYIEMRPNFDNYSPATMSVELAMHMKSQVFVCDEILTETIDTIGAAVEATLLTFPQVYATGAMALAAEKNKVARTARRGAANTNWNNVWFYNGTLKEDHAIFVMKQGDRYGIIKHPLFNCYGFRVAIPFVSQLLEYHRTILFDDINAPEFVNMKENLANLIEWFTNVNTSEKAAILEELCCPFTNKEKLVKLVGALK